MAEPPEQPRQLAPLAQKLVESAVAGGAALAALTGSPEAVGAAAAAPLVGYGLAQARAIIRQRWRRNAGEMLAEAARRAELEDDQLLERLLAKPARQELLAAALEAAAHATLEEKIKVLGRALAAGALGDDQKVDRELLFVRAMADLEPPHLRILEYLRRDPDRPGEQLWASSIRELAALPGIGVSVNPLVGVLQRHGAIEQAQLRGPAEAGMRNRDLKGMEPPAYSWYITNFGKAILARLRAAGEAD